MGIHPGDLSAFDCEITYDCLHALTMLVTIIEEQ
uniref:Uncharacterized protein n=1 Tax=Arundo donax TaxID=35708 RepID=A0A0A8ZSV3_ARUDO